MPIQKRPLVTAARFPGIFQHGTNQGLAQGITSAFGNVSNAMIQNKIMEASAAKEASIRATEEQARTFQFIAGLGDGKNVMEDDGKKRAMLRQLAREAGNSGQDMTPYMDALAIDAPDELNLHLARVATQLGATPAKPVILPEGAQMRGAGGGLIAENEKPDPDKYDYIKDYSLGNGQFTAAYVPKQPNSGLEVIPQGQPFEKKAMVEQTFNTGDEFGKLAANHRWKDPNNKALGQEPIPGTSADPIIKQATKYKEAVGILDKTEGSLDRYEKLFDQYGTKVLPSAAKQSLGGAYAAMQLEIKELAKLGVLAGPDMALIERILTDPLTFEGAAYEFFGGKEGFKAQMKLVRDTILEGRETAERLYGKNQGVNTEGGLTPEEEAELEALRKEFPQ